MLAPLLAPSARAAEYALQPGDSAVGDLDEYVTTAQDVLPDIARRFDLGFVELAAANPGTDAWLPGAGRRLTIPNLHLLPSGPRNGIVINLAQQRLFYFPPGTDRVVTYPIGIGVIGARTPIGTTRVVRKEPNPSWYPPASIRSERPDLPAVIPPGPDNPLGDFALRLGWPSYLLHGTNKPDGVGRNVSHGCIRLYPEDIAHLFEIVPVGTPVRVVEDAVLAGWIGVGLYVQVWPNKAQIDEIEARGGFSPAMPEELSRVVAAAAGQYGALIEWETVRQAGWDRAGIATRVGEMPPGVLPGPLPGLVPSPGPEAAGTDEPRRTRRR